VKYNNHIFICVNDRGDDSKRKSCGRHGGKEIRQELVKLISSNNLKGKIRANKSGCLDLCESGPVLVSYPQAKWYENVQIKNVKNIFHELLLNDNSNNKIL